ncbi:MAG TPA: 30S ribosomal protein S12 methylthiotransferase RimO [Bdellovibrionota bacterium]|nr:30S ribosomal protein S12 methylthiotransferase RimO [Bdellovibrionota bacterium]
MTQTQATQKSPVYFVSLGCPKNLVDSQVMLGKLESDRYSITQNPDEAEVIIVNTCSFIQASKEESVDTILEMAQKKETANCRLLVASGCMPQRYAKEMEKQLPEVDLLIGTGQYHRITELLNERAEGSKLGGSIPRRIYVDQPAFIHSESDPRMHTGPAYTGYLKLSEGCNRRCTFCIIPTLRGDVRSRTVDSLVTEAKNMAARGIRELNLVAQDLTHYGIDSDYRENLEKLLPALCAVEGVDWIRLHYVYPDQLSDEVIDLIAREPKIVKYLDMPIQHTNDRVLKRMGRKLTKKRLFEVMGKLRDRVPGVAIRTSIIVGFPGETEEEFEELCRDLKTLDIEYVGVFRYSREDGTAADRLDGHLHPSTRRRRWRALESQLLGRAQERAAAQVGRKTVALFEGKSEESDLLFQARLPQQAQEIDGHVLINDLGDVEAEALSPGDLVELEITESLSKGLAHHLMGRVTRVASPWRAPI